MAKGKGSSSKGGGSSNNRGGSSGNRSVPVATGTVTTNSNNPSKNTSTTQQLNTGGQLSRVGSTLSRREAEQIAERQGKSVAQVMAKAQEKGLGLTAGLVNNFNSGNLGPNFQSTGFNGQGVPVLRGQNAATMQALQSLQGLNNLKLGQGTAYYGASVTKTPGQSSWDPQGGSSYTAGRTTYNPIVLPKGYAGAAGGVGGGGGGGGAGGGGGGRGGRGGRGGGGNIKNDGTIESIKALYQQQFADAQAKTDEFINKTAEQIQSMQLDFSQQLADQQSSADERIASLNDLMLQQQQQSESTFDLLQQQSQAAQAAYQEQLRQANALAKAYVPTMESSASSAQLGDTRTGASADTNSLSNLAIVSGLGTNSNPLAGLQLA